MAIIRNTAAMRLNGTVGNTTYYTQGGRQLARVSQNSSNYGEGARRSPAQQRRRVMWANLVNFYKTSANWMHGAFETKARNESDYNKFMSVNLPNARVALTKEQALQGCCVHDSFIISQGSLRSISVTRDGNNVGTNIYCGISEAEWPEFTVARLSRHLIAANPFLADGFQISYIAYTIDFNPAGYPHLTCIRLEFVLDTSNEDLVSTLPIAAYMKPVSNRLTFGNTNPDSYVAVMLSDSTTGTLRVSTQSLVPGDEEVVAEYATEEAIETAMRSYGVDPTYFLESGYE